MDRMEVNDMDRPNARPGRHDGSGLLVWPLAGVIAGLIVYLIVLGFPGAHNGGTVLTFMGGGALAGLAIHALRRRSRR